MFTLNWPGKIIFGAGQIECLGMEAKALGQRVFLVTTRDLSRIGLTDRVQQLLEVAGLKVTRFEDVQPDPTSVAVDTASVLARSDQCDIVIAVGGGSAIDFGKAISVAATHDGLIWDYVTYTGANAKPVTSKVLPVIAIPTTAGTGSEVSQGIVLDNPEVHMKAALLSPYVYPRVALIDPELTYSMPFKVTTMTGFDALTHGIEAYLNVVKSNSASDMFALETVLLVTKYLPRLIDDENDHDARANMSWAATLGGISIALSNTTVAHAMALPLGSRLHTPHGLGLSRLLPVVMAHSWQAQPHRCGILADVIDVPDRGMNDDKKAQALVAWLRRFIQKIGLVEMWTGQGIDNAMLDLLTDDIFAYMGRPVQQHRPVFDRIQIWQMFEEALKIS